ncbi:hypothetical protein FSARC_14844 [Fusarium sarcochroum]|uniref:Uncharacterized protein n=1 Tax=Fusarium sarcochroum TaxID=1208366 RepID=A0A8H4WN79_9HYPO|nr:hypothetical protein FSARC_14844 [Fusarium sarcochroum]
MEIITLPENISTSKIDVIGAAVGFWTEDLPPAKTVTLKRKRGEEGSAIRQNSRQRGATAWYTVSVDKKKGDLRFSWRDSSGGYCNADKIRLVSGYTLERAEFGGIEAHDAYWETSIATYNRTLAVALGRRRIRQFAKIGSQGDAPTIDIDLLPTTALTPKLARDEQAATMKKILQQLI